MNSNNLAEYTFDMHEFQQKLGIQGTRIVDVKLDFEIHHSNEQTYREDTVKIIVRS